MAASEGWLWKPPKSGAELAAHKFQKAYSSPIRELESRAWSRVDECRRVSRGQGNTCALFEARAQPETNLWPTEADERPSLEVLVATFDWQASRPIIN